ncbi:putative alpha/beta superfamily hydrolase [Bacillus tianshenii]|uniref:Alpha/beta superfamily hydrolase n=1 Tax=Sutcliffiella tianshenii TaxID=1463404 RepID=A0ABS2NYX8_9BACI|nr:alpha/beta hydrolase-fold protein [Bacillus tianshenii]MBM7619688.1 putative alpha/beta superfamily hydrolase [Bacillus tianshenii]
MIEKFPIYIPSLKNERLVRVHLPEDYSVHVEKKYPVLYMHDGQNVFHDKGAIGGVSLGLEEYLNKNKLDVILVAIDQVSAERLNEYCPWENGPFNKELRGNELYGGKGKKYIDFIVNELKPLIDSKYRTISDHTSIAGISLGGLISTYAVCMYPQVFQHIILLSPSFLANQEEMENLIKQSDLSPIKSLYLDFGAIEAGKGTPINTAFVASNQTIYNLLKEKIANARLKIIDDGEHNYKSFKKRRAELFAPIFSGT